MNKNNRRQFIKKLSLFGLLGGFAPNLIKITPKLTREQYNIQLLKEIGRGNLKAQEEFAKFIGPVIKDMLACSPNISELYKIQPMT